MSCKLKSIVVFLRILSNFILLRNFGNINIYKVKVVPYTFVRRGVPVREDTYPEPSA